MEKTRLLLSISNSWEVSVASILLVFLWVLSSDTAHNLTQIDLSAFSQIAQIFVWPPIAWFKATKCFKKGKKNSVFVDTLTPLAVRVGCIKIQLLEWMLAYCEYFLSDRINSCSTSTVSNHICKQIDNKHSILINSQASIFVFDTWPTSVLMQQMSPTHLLPWDKNDIHLFGASHAKIYHFSTCS